MPAGSHENSWAGGIAFIRSCLRFLSSCLYYQPLHSLIFLSLLPFRRLCPLLCVPCCFTRFLHFFQTLPLASCCTDLSPCWPAFVKSGWALTNKLVLCPSFYEDEELGPQGWSGRPKNHKVKSTKGCRAAELETFPDSPYVKAVMIIRLQPVVPFRKKYFAAHFWYPKVHNN